MSVSDNLERNPKRKGAIVGLVSMLVLVTFAIVLYIFGHKGIFTVFIVLIVTFILMFIVGTIFFIVIKLIFPPKPDMLQITKQRIIQGAEMREPENKVLVYLMGDGRDFERKYLGELGGITRTILPPATKEVEMSDYKNAKDKSKFIKIRGKWNEKIGEPKEFFFITLKAGMFASPKVIGVLRKDLSNPNMSEIYIKDTTLNPPFGGVYFPSKYDNQSHMIEERLADYVKKYTMEDLLRDMKVIVDDAIQSSPAHQKAMENKGTLEKIGGVGENG